MEANLARKWVRLTGSRSGDGAHAMRPHRSPTPGYCAGPPTPSDNYLRGWRPSNSPTGKRWWCRVKRRLCAAGLLERFFGLLEEGGAVDEVDAGHGERLGDL